MSDILFIWLHRIVSGFSFFIIIPFFVLEYEKGNLNTLIDVNQYVVIFSILDGVLITGLSRYLRTNIDNKDKVNFASTFVFYIYCFISLALISTLYLSEFKYFNYVLIPILILPFRVVISHYFSINDISQLKKFEVINALFRLVLLFSLIYFENELELFIFFYAFTPSVIYFLLYFKVKLYKGLYIKEVDFKDVKSIFKNNLSGMFFTVPWVLFSTNAILSIPSEQINSTESKLLLSLFIAYMGFLGAFGMSLTPKLINKALEDKFGMYIKYVKSMLLVNFCALLVVFMLPDSIYRSLISSDINSQFIKDELVYFLFFYAIAISQAELIKSFVISTRDFLEFSLLQGCLLLVIYALSSYVTDYVQYFVYGLLVKSFFDFSYFVWRFRFDFKFLLERR